MSYLNYHAVAAAGPGISFVGSGKYVFINGQGPFAYQFSSLRNASGAVPTVLQNDVVVVCNGLAVSSPPPPDVNVRPSGYTAMSGNLYQEGGADSVLDVSRKFMGASPDTSVTIPNPNLSGTRVVGAVFVFRGVNLSTPLDVAAVTAGATANALPNAGAITPVTAGAWILICGNLAGSFSSALTRPADQSSTTNHFQADIRTGTLDSTTAMGLKTDWAAGAFDPLIFGGPASISGPFATAAWTAATIALRPA